MESKEISKDDYESTYEIGDFLGKGTYGKVYKATKRRPNDGSEFAMKIYPLGFRNDFDGRKKMMREAKEACKLIHPNIIETFHYCIVEDKNHPDEGKYFTFIFFVYLYI